MKRTHEQIRSILLARSVIDENGCRRWLGAKSKPVDGYGRLWDGEKIRGTHCLSYEVFKGSIPKGLDVLHTCDVTDCLEPEHLWTGTEKENTQDMMRKGRHKISYAMLGVKSEYRGVKHPKAILNEQQAREIKFGKREHGSRQRLAKKFNVSISLIDSIRRGFGWKWLEQ